MTQLLNDGAAVDQDRGDDATPLFLACRYGHVDAVKQLLDKGAAVDQAWEEGATPLIVAGIMYLVVTIPLTQLVAALERRQARAR